jgi:hypothetical protein
VKTVSYFVGFLCALVLAVPVKAKLDGTSSIVVQTTQYDFDSDSTPYGAEGFVWFQDGFLIRDSGACVLDIVTPVDGAIDLNTAGSGSLQLGRDLHFSSGVTMTGDGTITGGGHTIFLGGDLTYDDSVTLDSNITFDGQGHVMTFGVNATATISAGMSVTFKNMVLVLTGGSPGASFTMGSATSELVFDNTVVVWGEDYSISTGKITVKNKCAFVGDNSARTLTYTSTANFTIATQSQLLLGYNFTFKHNSTTTNNFVFTDRSSVLMLLKATFECAANATTLVLKDGTLWATHKDSLKASGTSGGIDLGVNTANQLYVVIAPAATLDAVSGTISYKGNVAP